MATGRHGRDREQDRQRDGHHGRAEDDRLPARTGLEEPADGQRRGQRPEAEEQVEQVQGPAATGRIEVEDEPVDAAVDGAAADPERDRRQEEQVPRRDRREPDQADADEGRGQRQDQSPPEPLGQDAAAHRAHDVDEGVDEEEHAEAGIGLVERRLDRADQRRHEEPGPADEHQGGAAEDRGELDPPRRGSGHAQMLAGAPAVYGRGMARSTAAPTPRTPPRPSGVLFFVHGADATSEGVVATLARIEDQVRARGWDVTVVAPEWRRASDLRLGNWRAAIHRRGRPSPMPVPILRGGLRRDAVMKIVTNYFEDRREALFEVIGPQMLADVIGYHAHRASIQRVLEGRADGGRQGAARPAGPAGRAQPRRDRPGGPARRMAGRAGRGVRHRRVAGAAALHLRCHPVDAVRRGRPAAPRRAVAEHLRHAATSCRSSPSRCSGAATASPASSTCGSGRARTSRSRTARTGSSSPVWDAIATAFTWRADRAADRPRGAAARASRRARRRRRPARGLTRLEERSGGVVAAAGTPSPAAAAPQRWKFGGCCEQHRDHRAEGHGRVQGEPCTREPLDLHGPPPVRQPGYLREARGFASPPRDGFAIVDRSPPGSTLTDCTSLGSGARGRQRPTRMGQDRTSGGPGRRRCSAELDAGGSRILDERLERIVRLDRGPDEAHHAAHARFAVGAQQVDARRSGRGHRLRPDMDGHRQRAPGRDRSPRTGHGWSAGPRRPRPVSCRRR